MDRNEIRVPNHFAQKSKNVPIKPQPFDGFEDFDEFEYFTHFEILCDLHGWDFRSKSLYLASSLTVGARAVLSELNGEQRWDFRLQITDWQMPKKLKLPMKLPAKKNNPIFFLNQDKQSLREDLQSLTLETRALIRNGQKSTQYVALNPHASYENQGSYQNPHRLNYPNQKPTSYEPKPQCLPNQRNPSNGSNYPNNSRPFQPRRQGNYPMSN